MFAEFQDTLDLMFAEGVLDVVKSFGIQFTSFDCGVNSSA